MTKSVRMSDTDAATAGAAGGVVVVAQRLPLYSGRDRVVTHDAADWSLMFLESVGVLWGFMLIFFGTDCSARTTNCLSS